MSLIKKIQSATTQAQRKHLEAVNKRTEMVQELERIQASIEPLMEVSPLFASDSPLAKTVLFNLCRAAGEELFTWVKREPDRKSWTSPKRMAKLEAEIRLDLLKPTLDYLKVFSVNELARRTDAQPFGTESGVSLLESLMGRAIALMMESAQWETIGGRVHQGVDGIIAAILNKEGGLKLKHGFEQGNAINYAASSAWSEDDELIDEDGHDEHEAQRERERDAWKED
jgi:hypothetical protein